MTLPYDVIVDIISRLPLKLIIGCKFLSKALNELISGPSFSQIYLTKNSNSFWTLNLDATKTDCFLDLVEFDNKGNHETVQILNTERFPGGSSSSCKLFSICGYCNGLICLVNLGLGLNKCFVLNPILCEFIQLPDQVDCDNEKRTYGKWTLVSYGLGHCQLSNRYKVLRVITGHLGGDTCKVSYEIYTIGYDQIWRSVLDVNVPHYITPSCDPQPIMVPLRSALHWIVYHVSSSLSNSLDRWKHKINVCAFDMTEENVSALPLPPKPALPLFCLGSVTLTVFLDKLCLTEPLAFNVNFWVMDEYGVEESWTKKLVLSLLWPQFDPRCNTLIPLIVSPGGLILISDRDKTIVYDTKNKICLTEIHRKIHYSYPVRFIPNFVSLRNFVQPSRVNARCSIRSGICSY